MFQKERKEAKINKRNPPQPPGRLSRSPAGAAPSPQPIAARPTWPTRRRHAPPPNPSRCAPSRRCRPSWDPPVSAPVAPVHLPLPHDAPLSLPPLPRRPLFFPGPDMEFAERFPRRPAPSAALLSHPELLHSQRARVPLSHGRSTVLGFKLLCALLPQGDAPAPAHTHPCSPTATPPWSPWCARPLLQSLLGVQCFLRRGFLPPSLQLSALALAPPCSLSGVAQRGSADGRESLFVAVPASLSQP